MPQMLAYLIPLSALIVTMGGIIITVICIKHSEQKERLARLEKEIDKLQESVQECRKDREKLMEENLVLMQKLLIRPAM